MKPMSLAEAIAACGAGWNSLVFEAFDVLGGEVFPEVVH
jgi:hypothetical protein